MDKPLIGVEQVDFVYPDKTRALDGVSLDIYPAEMLALIGRNGSGKTTLAKHLNGLLKPASGKVLVASLDTRATTVAQIAKYVGYVFQNPGHQIFSQTVEEEVGFGLKCRKLPAAQIQAKVEETLERVGIGALAKSHPLFLTLSEKQLVAIASCVILEPSVLILDEPTSCLDLPETERVLGLMHKLHAAGTSIVIITHDMRLVAEDAGRVVAMQNTHVVFDGKPRDLFEHPEILAQANLRPPQVASLSKMLYPDAPAALSVAELVKRGQASYLARSAAGA